MQLISIVLFIVLKAFACPDTVVGTQVNPGERMQGKIVKVFDGDTYELMLADNTTVRVRMEGIDAPEGGMPFYQVSKRYLTDLAAGEEVEILVTDIDQYKRIVAFTYLEDGRELSREMLRAGMAWHYKKYNQDADMTDLELHALTEGLGLWSERDPVPPWMIRRIRRTAVSTKNLLVFRERVMNPDEAVLRSGDIRLELSTDADSLLVYKDAAFIQSLSLPQMDKRPIISLADYNMNGAVDILISDNIDDYYYYFFDAADSQYLHNPAWNFRIWKLNTTTMQILVFPEGSVYEGSVRLYEIEEDGAPVEVRRVEYE